jgi:hypothetical protein
MLPGCEAIIHSALTTSQTEYFIDIGPGPNIRRVVPGYDGPSVTTTASRSPTSASSSEAGPSGTSTSSSSALSA